MPAPAAQPGAGNAGSQHESFGDELARRVAGMSIGEKKALKKEVKNGSVDLGEDTGAHLAMAQAEKEEEVKPKAMKSVVVPKFSLWELLEGIKKEGEQKVQADSVKELGTTESEAKNQQVMQDVPMKGETQNEATTEKDVKDGKSVPRNATTEAQARRIPEPSNDKPFYDPNMNNLTAAENIRAYFIEARDWLIHWDIASAPSEVVAMTIKPTSTLNKILAHLRWTREFLYLGRAGFEPRYLSLGFLADVLQMVEVTVTKFGSLAKWKGCESLRRSGLHPAEEISGRLVEIRGQILEVKREKRDIEREKRELAAGGNTGRRFAILKAKTIGAGGEMETAEETPTGSRESDGEHDLQVKEEGGASSGKANSTNGISEDDVVEEASLEDTATTTLETAGETDAEGSNGLD